MLPYPISGSYYKDKTGAMGEQTQAQEEEVSEQEEPIFTPVQYMNFSFGSSPEDSDCMSEEEMANTTYISNLARDMEL